MRQPPLSFNAWLRYDLIRPLVSQFKDASSFLEVGCGGGSLGVRLARRFQYRGVESDPVSFALARERVGRSGTVLNCFLPPEPDRTFDILGAFEVLEHMEDDAAALSLWRKWLKPGGRLLLSVPAGPARFGPADAIVGHYRRYARKQLLHLLHDCGFVEPVVWTYGFPLGYVLEFGRNRLAGGHKTSSVEERTAASGRWMQVDDRLAWMTAFVTFPFRLLQRPFTGTSLGTGLVAMARRPT